MKTEAAFIYLVVFLCICFTGECRTRNEKKLLRKKRYIAFPEGAAFSAVWCLTSQMGITDSASIFSEGINWGLVYDLPNDTRPLLEYYGASQKRRNRRDLYSKVETLLQSMGYNGRTCILRSLCEASRHFKPREDSLIHHIIATIFRFPTDPIMAHEPDEHRVYHWAAELGSNNLQKNNMRQNDDCSDIFPCPFSLIDMALGHYSGAYGIDEKNVN
ncbi:uncharacterized protein LOC126734269 [Anthonomus grandis grandis]|uniref:uncharacterized protein LOC126734269 n=1 Tax=Anthonomus grandis grandis TaxID=2921223 RepID=UPI0021669553|nr:uncharacterized protein LOC126734269 [Anthonomus grandis grandis]